MPHKRLAYWAKCMKQHFPDIGVQEIQDQDALEKGNAR